MLGYKDCYVVFGKVLNMFHIAVDETIAHVVSPLCRKQVALFDRLEEKLNKLHRLDIIKPVNGPTVEKPNSKH